jgi:hypothetical protein
MPVLAGEFTTDLTSCSRKVTLQWRWSHAGSFLLATFPPSTCGADETSGGRIHVTATVRTQECRVPAGRLVNLFGAGDRRRWTRRLATRLREKFGHDTEYTPNTFWRKRRPKWLFYMRLRAVLRSCRCPTRFCSFDCSAGIRRKP